MQMQTILDVMHEITDARKKVAEEYQAHMNETGNNANLTIQNMLSWERSVRAEKAMYRMIALMPRNAAELELPETDHAVKAAAMCVSMEAASKDQALPVPIRELLDAGAKEIRILSFQVFYKIGRKKK